MLNNQPPEKRDTSTGIGLYVHKIFPTIQGEGPLAGRPAVFVRLAGCNLQCPLCDTEYTARMHLQISLIAKEIKKHKINLVVITGGEPFRQNIGRLVALLDSLGHLVQIETNGTLQPEPHFPYHACTIVCSPKAGKVAEQLRHHVIAYKYVMDAGSVHPDDGLPIRALEHPVQTMVARPPRDFPRTSIYLQPVDEQDVIANRINLAVCIKSVMTHGYTLGVQIHKQINME